MQRLRVLIATMLVVSASGSLSSAADENPDQPAASPDLVAPGGKLPAMKMKALLPGEKEPRDIDLGAYLGKRPVVFCYFRIEEAVGEEGCLGVQSLVSGEIKDKVAVLDVTNLGTKVTMARAVTRMSDLGFTVPLVLDEDLALGRALGVTSAPSMTLVDGGGVLRIADAKSLKQTVVGRATLAQTIQSAAKGEPIQTVAKLARYFPANELVGEPFPDFMLKKFQTTERLKLSEVVSRDQKENKLPVVFFWHPNCPHCKKAMPGIMVGYNSYKKWLDLISVVDLKNADEVRNAQDTIKAHNITFPVLEDEDRRITDMYKVISTPTFVFLKPNGIVDSVYTSGDVNFVPVFSAKIHALLGVGGAGSKP